MTLFSILLLPLLTAAQPAPRVTTTSGIAFGVSSDKVDAFLGVPYAIPPVDQFRWKHAQELRSPTATINATTFGPGCGQLLVPGLGSIFYEAGILSLPASQAEDCLTLNVWSPRRKINGQKLPVLFFVHGGGYQSGSSADVNVDSQSSLAGTGRAIVITPNYRLNIWGFPSSSQHEDIDQNIGISDVRLALEWTRKNVAKFGGDPERIILGGHSAGASIGEIMNYAYRSDPIVSAHLAMSHVVQIVNPQPTNGFMWNLVASSLGCGNNTDSSQLTCMRQISFTALNNKTRELGAYFAPTSDGTVVYTNDDYLTLSANGSFPPIPTWFSNVDREASLLMPPYSNAFPPGTTEEMAMSVFVCPEAVTAVNRQRQGLPVWRSRYFPTWLNLAPFKGVGAYHGSDLFLLFNAYQAAHIGNGSVVPAEHALARKLQNALLAFIEQPAIGLARLGWPTYNETHRALVRLGEHNSSVISIGDAEAYESCP